MPKTDRGGGRGRGGRDRGGPRGRGGKGGDRGGRGGRGDRGGRGRGGRGDRGGGRGDRGGGRGRGRGGGGRGGGFGRGGRTNKFEIEKHRHPGVFIAKGGGGRGKEAEEMLVTLNLTPEVTVYDEKLIKITNPDGETFKEYRHWNPFRSKLASAILKGVENIYMGPGSKVLYLGAASGTTVSHVSDIVGETGVVYAVEFSPRTGRELLEVAKKRSNIVPIIEDARKPWKYRMLIGTMVDVIFEDVAQNDQARILGLNAQYFLKNGGAFVLSIKANCIDSTIPAEHVFENQVSELKKMDFRPREIISLEPYERDHAVVTGLYRTEKKKKKKTKEIDQGTEDMEE